MIVTIAILLFLAAVLALLEAMLPTGGILGVLAFVCTAAALVLLFSISPTAGWIGVFAVLLAVPVLLVLGLWIFPRSPLGRRWALTRDAQGLGKDVILDPQRDTDAQSLVGRRGVTLSACRPVGTCLIDDRRLECLSVSGTLDPGIPVEVVSVQGIEVRVRKM